MSKQAVVVLDYGVGNVYSILKALEFCGAVNVSISADPVEIIQADRLILPGVGAFSDAMNKLTKNYLDETIKEFAGTGRPVLGICLGMQLLATTSKEFGSSFGLDLIPGRVEAIPPLDVHGLPLKVPFIGWSTLNQIDNVNAGILRHITVTDSVYFVHSFQVIPDNQSDLLATYEYGGHDITAAISKNNITGLQFHPEKSGEIGLSILKSFIKD